MAFYQCNGTPTETSPEVWSCDVGFSLVDAADLVAQLTAYGIDSATILYVYTWGAGAVLSLWALGYAVGVAVKVINKA